MAEFFFKSRSTGAITQATADTPFDPLTVGVAPGIYDVYRGSVPAEITLRGENNVADVIAAMPTGFRMWVAGMENYSDTGKTTLAGEGDFVRAMNDLSANDSTMTQTGTGTAPILRLDGNGLPYWEFDTVDDKMSITDNISAASLTMGMSYGGTPRQLIAIGYVSNGSNWAYAAQDGSTSTFLTSANGGPINSVYVDNVSTGVPATRGEAFTEYGAGTTFLMNFSDPISQFNQVAIGEIVNNFTTPTRLYAYFICPGELTELQREIWHDFALAAATTGVSAT